MGPLFGIFISYRRDSAAAFAGRLYDCLIDKLGKEHVFIDIDTIEPGEDFIEVLDKKLAQAVALIVLIGRDWLTCKDADGKAKLSNPNDFVRLEVATALKSEARVIPVLIDGARVPSSKDLPPDLASLSRRQAIAVDHGRFHQDVARLIDVCQQLLRQRAAENERTVQEKKAAEERQREMLNAEAGRKAREQADALRIAREKKLAEERRQAEADRVGRERAEAERIAREKKLAEERRQAEADRAGRERAEAERIAREKKLAEERRQRPWLGRQKRRRRSWPGSAREMKRDELRARGLRRGESESGYSRE